MWAWCQALCHRLCLGYLQDNTAKQAFSSTGEKTATPQGWVKLTSHVVRKWKGRSQTRNQGGSGHTELVLLVLNWESADPSCRAGRGASNVNLTPTHTPRENHLLGSKRSSGNLWHDGQTAGAFLLGLPPNSQRDPWIRNSKNKAEQPLRGRFAERHFTTCKLFQTQVIWEPLAPGSRNKRALFSTPQRH